MAYTIIYNFDTEKITVSLSKAKELYCIPSSAHSISDSQTGEKRFDKFDIVGCFLVDILAFDCS